MPLLQIRFLDSVRFLRLVPKTFLRLNHVAKQNLFKKSFLGLLAQCSDREATRQIHACLCIHGLAIEDDLWGSKILSCYANSGCLDEARKIFDVRSNRKFRSWWDSIVIGYFRAGMFDEVLRTYSRMKEDASLDGFVCTFSLKSCVELRLLRFGRGIHANGFKIGVQTDKFVGTSLIELYVGHERLDDAYDVFDEIANKDVVVHTAIISGFAQSSTDFGPHMALRVASDMQIEGLLPNRVTCVSLLKAASRLESVRIGKSIHCYAIRREMDLDEEIFRTSLIDMYMNCGGEDVGSYLFYNAEVKTVSSYNAMITSYIQGGKPLEPLNLFHRMKNKEKFSPDSVTLSNILSVCKDLRYFREGSSIHGYIIRREICLDVVGYTALIEMYAECKIVSIARHIFDETKSRDTILFNVMIAAYCKHNFIVESFCLFSLMGEMGVKPNIATILNLLAGCVTSTGLEEGIQIHSVATKYGFNSNLEVTNQIIDLYAKHGCLNAARVVFDTTETKDLISWTSMMMGYVNQGRPHEAFDLLCLMQYAKQKPDLIALTVLLIACSQIGWLKQVKIVHGHLYRVLWHADVSIINCLIMAYSRCGLFTYGELLFHNMMNKSLASWNTMISACGIHGKCAMALELLDRMQQENVQPDAITFTSLLSACSHAGFVEEGWCLFRSMTVDHLIVPCDEHYACMIDLLGRSGHLEEARDLMKLFPLKNNARLLDHLLGACSIHHNSELGEIICRDLMHIDPQNSGTYTLVSNMYAGTGKWSEVQKIRDAAKARKVEKIPGYSWIEPNGMFQ